MRKLLATIEIWLDEPSLAPSEISNIEDQAKLLALIARSTLEDELRRKVWSGLAANIR